MSSTQLRCYEDDVLRNSGIESLQVVPFPTEKQVLAARDRLLKLIADFPLRSERCRSAWLAGLLTVVARPRLLRGPSPVFVVSADEPGLGASLLCDVAAVLATGERMRRVNLAGSSQQQKNRTLAATEKTHGLTAICVEPMPSPRSFVIEQFLHSGAVWWFSGVGERIVANDAFLAAHASKFLVSMHLTAELRRPASELHIPDLCGYVTEFREGYLVDCLTLLHGAMQDLPDFESFDWSELIQGALSNAKLADPFAEVQS